MVKKISTWDDIRPSLQGTANHDVTVVVEREGQTIETTVIPKMEQDSPKIGIYLALLVKLIALVNL